MALSAKGGNTKATKKDIPTKDTHLGRLVGLTDLGHQPGFEYQGKEIQSSFKVEFTYELVNSLMEDGRPHWVSEEVSVNDFEGDGVTSTMMARVRAIDKANDTNNGRDLEKMIGKPCMIAITHNDKGYPKIKGQAAVSGIPSGLPVPELVNPSFVFDLDNPDMEVWEKFPEWKQDKIKAAFNYKETKLYKELVMAGDEGDDEDSPF